MKNLKSVFTLGMFVLLLSPLFYGCSGNEEANEASDSDTLDMADNGLTKSKSKLKNILYAIPSPIELAQLVQKAGAKYNKDLLNAPDKISKYSTTASKALNLGVYGADLSYTGVFDDNTQESIVYLTCTRKLAEQLGVGSAFNENTVSRIQNNTGMKDSLLSIISDSYMNTDEMLKENQRESASALVIAGGFIEALYLGTQLAKTSKNPQDIIARIAEQKGTMNNVVGLLSAFEGDPTITPIINDLKALKEIYDQVVVESKSTNADVKTNPNTKITTIGGKITYSMTPELVEKLTIKSAEIRTKIIEGQI
ncbi:MAG TPA: hypothetical protein VFL70_05330 [Bacteroidia bacterium]|jgi:hypothetical protein|nr:hypothetical protein [Bacteroidia bacterium]HNO70420.1 hypothetical protein [Bacteroidia bacterium]